MLPNVPGKSIRGVLVEYEPGGSSPAHTHPNSAFIYATVLQGAMRSQVNDGPVTTYHAGESFSEFLGDRHGVSANASDTEPMRLLAVFVVGLKCIVSKRTGSRYVSGRTRVAAREMPGHRFNSARSSSNPAFSRACLHSKAVAHANRPRGGTV